MTAVTARLRRSAEWRLLALFPRADPVRTAAWWALVFIRGLLPATFTIAVGLLVGVVQHGGNPTTALVIVGTVFVAMNALGPLHETVSAELGALTGALIHDRLMRACIEPSGLAHLERPDLADELSRARSFDLGQVGPPLEASVPRIGSGFAEILGGVAQGLVLLGYAWWAPILVASAWIATHFLLRDSSSWKTFGSEPVVKQQRQADYAFRIAVDAPAAKEVRMFSLGRWAVDLVTQRRRSVVDTVMREQRLRQGPVRWALLVIVAANAIVLWSLARDAEAGRLGLSALLIFAQAAIGTNALAYGEFDWWFRGSAEPVPGLLDLMDRMAPVGALPAGSLPAAGKPASEIRFSDVRFAYTEEAAPVLEGFDLTIPAGTSLAIVGPNGAGKTTLAKLLCRLYDPTSGAVLIDGQDLRDIDVDAWRGRLAAVFQDFIRYERPLRDNVAPLGAPDAEVMRALEGARAGELATLDTVLSRQYEHGTDLSGGQWQRVALARALCAVQLGASVVLLDEPTAQLDVRGEAEIFDRLLEATRGCTTILISHRFSTVRHADRICVLEGGRVVELGTHDELMEKAGRYRTMFDLQASRFEDGEIDEEAV